MMSREESGFFAAGLPYNRLGNGPRRVVAFQGLLPDNKPLSGLMATLLLRAFRFLAERYTVYVVTRRPGLPQGYTLADAADDYAAVVRDELGGPLDMIGLSTGGSIAQVFAARHPELLDRLVLYSAAYTLVAEGRQFQRRLAELARAHRWDMVAAEGFAFMFLPRTGISRQLTRPIARLVGLVTSIFGRPPAHPTDFVVTIDAEDEFDFRSRLGEIRAPTLVIAGAKDPFYSPALFRETAAGIPDSRLILYANAGHGPSGKQVARDILAFLEEDAPRSRQPTERELG